jgi:hypothetical protein
VNGAWSPWQIGARVSSDAVNPLPVAVACVAGALFGTAYTLSPMLIWFGLGMVPLFAWAGKGLGRRERTWVFALLGSALALRLLTLLVFYFLTRPVDGVFPLLVDQPDGTFPEMVPDEWYVAYRARSLRYLALGVPLGSHEYAEMVFSYGQTSLISVRAYLDLLVGEAPYTMRLFDSALYLAACVTLYRTVRPAFGALAALGGLAVVLFLPSLFGLSIAFLKETPSLFLTAISVGAASAMARTRSWRIRALACAILGAAVFAVSGVRSGAGVILAGGLMAGLLGVALLRRPLLMTVTLVACLVGGAVVVQRSPDVRQWGRAQLLRAATYHIGFTYTPGLNYKLFDPDWYPRSETGQPLQLDPERFTPASTARYVIRATASIFLFPFPWDARSPAMLAYLPEQLVWNLLVVLGGVGVVAGFRVDPALTVILVGIVAVGAVLIGVASGNYGTMIRHRSMLVMLVPWLASLGACELLTRAARFGALAGSKSSGSGHDRGVYAVD